MTSATLTPPPGGEAADPVLPVRHGPVGGAHLSRTFDRDPDAFAEPSSSQEQWRFAPLRDLRPLLAAPPAEQRLETAWAAGDLVELVPIDDPVVGTVHTPFDRMSALTLRRAEQALLVRVTGEPAEPLRVGLHGSGGTAYGHVVIDAAAHSCGVVVLDYSGAASYSANVEVRVGDGADLTVLAIADWEPGALHVEAQTVALGRDARIRHAVVALGGAVVRVTPNVRFLAPGGDAELLGLYFADAGQHMDFRLLVDHDQPHCKSRVTYKGALSGETARAVWTGDVVIRTSAVGTDTYELNRNLLLSPGARADSVPNLEIETGEVVGAGHASATGRFDDEQLFYLMSRGIPADIARRLVVRGYFADLIERIGVPGVGERLLASVEDRLGGPVAPAAPDGEDA